MTYEDNETDKIVKKNNLSNMGKRIHNIRSKLGLTMAEFASKIDDKAKSGTVSNWEHGKNAPNSARLAKIAKLGNTSTTYITMGISQEAFESGINQLTKIKNEFKSRSEKEKDQTLKILSNIDNMGYSQRLFLLQVANIIDKTPENEDNGEMWISLAALMVMLKKMLLSENKKYITDYSKEVIDGVNKLRADLINLIK